MNTKKLNEMQRQALVYDIERGKAEVASCPSLGRPTPASARGITTRTSSTTTATNPPPEVIRMLADIVSKNGNLMLSVPLQRDGQPDAEEIKIVSEIGAWLKVNGEAIYATRPWKMLWRRPVCEER